ncbi:hypothetical protein PGT21_001458 [Puccinia graminis f. sp. tritici]|uniref:Uncharacterized protein n=1 Tax=Puccinia graminis f. sp. tritici TaxID=56615 RepID=A0A5B0M4Z3_PUCGR|nr:hypothetical protein PGT21_001458 [Puccinia graminis f. sp. tritici]
MQRERFEQFMMLEEALTKRTEGGRQPSKPQAMQISLGAGAKLDLLLKRKSLPMAEWLGGFRSVYDCHVSQRLKLQGETKIDSDSHPHTHSSTCHILKSSSMVADERLKCGLWLTTDAFAYATGRSR